MQVVKDPGGVEAEVDADVTVLIEAGVVEGGAEAYDADGGGTELPERVELALVGEVECFFFARFEDRPRGGADLGRPEPPAHFELVGHVVVVLLGGFGDGAFDEGTGCVGVFLGTVVVDVDALVGWGFGEGDGVDGGDGDAFVSTDKGELAEDGDERGGKGLEAEVREPETKVKLIGHRSSLDAARREGGRSAGTGASSEMMCVAEE